LESGATIRGNSKRADLLTRAFSGSDFGRQVPLPALRGATCAHLARAERCGGVDKVFIFLVGNSSMIGPGTVC
jgi:hypothetical protein